MGGVLVFIGHYLVLSTSRTNVEHIFDCFCEVSAPDGHNQQARVVQKLPDSYNEEEMLKQFSLFAFPSMSPW